ncbi:MAG: hypothetical protein ABIU10_05765 [Sphingomicrobium sp.]
MAMVWAVGIIWFALEVSGPGETVAAANGQQAITDVTGAPVSNEQVKEIESIIKDL